MTSLASQEKVLQSQLEEVRGQLLQRSREVEQLSAQGNAAVQLAAKRREGELQRRLAEVEDAREGEVRELQRRLDAATAAASQSEAQLTAEIARVQQSKAAELDNVAKRVTGALAKRDKVIESLKARLAEVSQAQRETEALLERQRRELLGED